MAKVLRLMYVGVGLLALLSSFAYAQPKGPELYLDICRFQDLRGNSPFVQMYIAVAGRSLTFEEVGESRFQARVKIDMKLNRLADGDTLPVGSDSYFLELPADRLLSDSSMEVRSQANLFNVHTEPLPPGNYLIMAEATDINSRTPITSMALNEFIMDSIQSKELAFSDIKWVAGEMPQKPGTRRRIAGRDDLVPLVTNSTFFNEDTLEFYQEIYRAGNVFEDKFWIRCVLYQGDNRLFAYETRPQVRQIRDIAINAYKQRIPIANLSSNTYHLQVELLDNRNRPVEVFRKKIFVYNPRKDADFEFSVAYTNPETDIFNQYDSTELDYYIKTLHYRSTEQERNFARALGNTQQKKNYIYSWFEKRQNANNNAGVQAMWNGHLAMLKYVNQQFKSSSLEGWQTDRGRVFLTYGTPNDIERFPFEPNLLPYEIWRYNRMASQTNVTFIFFNPDLATDEYPPLHSTRYGEVNNPRWRDQLYTGNQGPTTLDFEDQNDPRNRPDTKIIIDD